MNQWWDTDPQDDVMVPRDPATGEPNPTGEAPPAEWPGLGNLWRQQRELRRLKREVRRLERIQRFQRKQQPKQG